MEKINLIGVTGKMGSGKDLTANIIQYLMYCKKNGKMSYSSWELLDSPYSGWANKKFSKKLKLIASILTGIPANKFEDQEFKKTCLGEEWSYIDITHSNGIPKTDRISKNERNLYGNGLNSVLLETSEYYTVRSFLQRLATDCIRDGLHPDTWVNALFSDYNPIGYKMNSNALSFEATFIGGKMNGIPTNSEPIYPNWIITDVRFPNEYKAIKSRGGIIIRKYGVEEFSSSVQNFHKSETALDDFEVDYELHYCEEIETLIKQVKEILIKEEIL